MENRRIDLETELFHAFSPMEYNHISSHSKKAP